MRSFLFVVLLLVQLISENSYSAPDIKAPVITSNVTSNAFTKAVKLTISISDASSVTSEVKDLSGAVIATHTTKKFDIPLAEGVNNFVIVSKDSSNNVSPNFNLSNITQDSKTPVITTSQTSNVVTKNPVINVQVTDPTAVNTKVTFNGVETLYTTNSIVLNLIEGINSGTVVSEDAAKNKTTLNLRNIKLDTLAPQVSANVSSNTLTKSNKITVTVDEAGTVSTKIEKEGLADQFRTQKSFTLTLTEGLNNFKLSAGDGAGNQSNDLILSNIRLDTKAPVVSSTVLSGARTNQNRVRFTITDDSNVTTIIKRNDIQIGVQTSKSFDVELVEGSNKIELHATDELANKTTTYVRSNIVLDTAVPFVSSLVISNSFTKTKNVRVSITDALAVSSEVFRDGFLESTQTAKAFNLVLNEGVNNFKVTTKDAVQNQAPDFILSQVVLDTKPPVLSSNVNSGAVVASNKIHISISDAVSVTTIVKKGSAVIATHQTKEFDIPLTSGLNSFTLLATDGLGTKAANFNISNVRLNADVVAPVLSANVSSNAITSGTKVRISITDQSNVTTEVYNNDALVSTEQSKQFDVILNEGINNLVLKAKDEYNNQASNFVISNISVDTKAPTFVSSVASGATVTNNQIHISISDAAAVRTEVIHAQSGNSVQTSSEFDLTLFPGPNSFVLTATDAVGNKTTIEILDLVFDDRPVDQTPPQIIVPIVYSGAVTTQERVQVTVNDETLTRTEVYRDDVLIISNYGDVEITLTEGINNLKIKATDESGNVSNLDLNYLIYIAQPPIVASPNPGTATKDPMLYVKTSGGFPGVILLATLNFTERFSSTVNQLGIAELYVGLVEGFNNVGVQYVDSFGGLTPATQVDVILDTIYPNVSVGISGNIAHVSIADASEVVYTQIHKNGEEVFLQDSKTFDITLEVDTAYMLQAMDQAGNLTQYTLDTGTLDISPPVLIVNPAIGPTKADKANVSIADQSNVSTEVFKVDFGLGHPVFVELKTDMNFDLPIDEGDTIYILKASDQFGNKANDFILFYRKDSIAPVLTYEKKVELIRDRFSHMPREKHYLQVSVTDGANQSFGTQIYQDGALVSAISGSSFRYDLVDGVNTVTFRTYDDAENFGDDINYSEDWFKPIIQTFLNRVHSNGPVNRIHISISDASSTTTEVSVGDYYLVTELKEFDIFPPDQFYGNYNGISIFSTDAGGRVATGVIANFQFDTTRPMLLTDLKSQYHYNSFPQLETVTFEVNEETEMLTVNGEYAYLVGYNTYSYTFEVAEPGTKEFTVITLDTAGNETVLQQSVDFIMDQGAPVITTNPIPAIIGENEFDLNVIIGDSMTAQTKVFIDDVEVLNTPDKVFTYKITFDSDKDVQSKRINIVAEDSSGNLANKTFTIAKDISPLLVQIISPQNQSILNSPVVEIRARANKPLAVARINGELVPIGSDQISIKATMNQPVDGPFIVLVEVVDVNGVTASHQVQAEINSNSMPSWTYEEICPVQ